MQALNVCRPRITAAPALPQRATLGGARPALRPPTARVAKLSVSCQAGENDDPYEVLGIRGDADYNAIQRAYRLKMAEARGDDKKTQAIEQAHGSLMMGQLTAQLKKGVNKDVAFADKAVYFPWRPRLYVWEQKWILISAGINAVLAAWGVIFSVTAVTQPVIAAAMVGTVMNIFKQNSIFPPASSLGASDKEKAQGAKNILRSLLLAGASTMFGMWLFYTAPQLVGDVLGKTMPVWFYTSQNAILSLGSCTLNFATTAFFR